MVRRFEAHKHILKTSYAARRTMEPLESNRNPLIEDSLFKQTNHGTNLVSEQSSEHFQHQTSTAVLLNRLKQG